MVNEYKKIVMDGILSDVDVNDITLDNIIIRWDIYIDKYIFGNPSYLGYSCIINDRYYILVLKDSTEMSVSRTDINEIWHGEMDIITIKNSINYEFYNFNFNWFYKDDNLDEMCEMEMERIRPLIRKEKIRYLLNF